MGIGQNIKTNMLILILGLSILVISSFTKKARSLKLNERKWSVFGLIGFLTSLLMGFMITSLIVRLVKLEDYLYSGINILLLGCIFLIFRYYSFRMMEKEGKPKDNNILDDPNF